MEHVNPQLLPFIWFAIIYNAFWVGGFLNVFIYRLPIMIDREHANALAEHLGNPVVHTDTYNLAWPPSACPHCHTRITYLQMFPVVAWILMRGKCRHCGSPISIRYPLVEFICGAMIAGAAYKFGLPMWWQGAGLGFLSVALFSAAIIDAETSLLPDVLTIGVLWAGLIFNLRGGFITPAESICSAAGTYLLFSFTAWLFTRLRKVEGVGAGDIKLLAAIAAWEGGLSVMFVGILAMILFVTLFPIIRRRFSDRIPFGPYLSAAGIIVAWTGVQHYA